MVSHGEVLRSGYDQNMEFDPQGCQWLIQGITNQELNGHYDLLPRKVGLITKIEENGKHPPEGKARTPAPRIDLRPPKIALERS